MGLPAMLTNPWFEANFIADCSADGSFRHNVSFNQSQGLFLWCPCGFEVFDKFGNEKFPLDLSQNKGRPHGVIIPFHNPPCGVPVPENFGPFSRSGKSRPRWTVQGSGISDLTLDPSIAVGDPECWHGFIRLGIVKN